jgi:hypothetical protein
MSKPSPARFRTTNWSSYTATLKKRGSLPIWLDKEMTWLAPPDGSPGRPAVFSDATIQFCLTIKVLFKLPLRQTTGMVASLLKMADLGWAVPDYTTLCRRQRTLAVQIPYRRADGPLNLLVDIEPVSATGSSEPASGIKFLGDGEWQARKHGVQGLRQWRKVHLAMDTATSDIRAVEFTPSSDGDSPVLPELLDQIPGGEQIGTVTADGTDDTRRCHTAIINRQATAIIPIRKNGRHSRQPLRPQKRHSRRNPQSQRLLVPLPATLLTRSEPDRNGIRQTQGASQTHRGQNLRCPPQSHRRYLQSLQPRRMFKLLPSCKLPINVKANCFSR